MRRYSPRPALVAALVALACFLPRAWGQDPGSLTLTQLQEQAISLVDSKSYVVARPYLQELITRFEGESPEKRKMLEAVFFYMGVSYLVEYSQSPNNQSLEEAIKWFERLEKEFPGGGFSVRAHLFEADCYRGLQQFEKAADIYEKMLRPPLELKMSNQERLEVLEKLSQALYIKQQWERGLPYFAMFLRESPDTDNQAMAAAALLEGNIKLGRFDQALEYLRFLVGESPARYNLQLNVALIDAGDRLAKEERYTEAMLMYRMVLTVEEILEWQKRRLVDLERQLQLLRLSTTDRSNERGIELETDIFNTKAQIEALEKLDSYTPELRVRIARNYLLTNRDWESFFAYSNIIEDYPDHPGTEDFIYAAFTGATKIGMDEEVIRLGERYLENSLNSTYRDDIIIKLLQYYRDQGEYDDFFELAKKFVTGNPDTDYARSVVHLMGQTYVQLQQFDELLRQFEDWEKQYPNTSIDTALYYWTGLALTFVGNYNEAWEYFNRILTDYPSSAYAQDALYRRGICYMGTDDYEAARRDFLTFIRKYPDTPLRGEAEYFLGEIDASLANVESALEHFGNVEKYTDNIAFIQNAYMQMGSLLEVNQRYDAMAQVYEDFIKKFADRGELTGAIYHLGRAHELNSQPHLMLKEYLQAIQEYGDDPYSYGLDDILKAYPEGYELNQERIAENLEFLQRLNDDPAFRKMLQDDRAELFNYLAARPLIKEDIKRALYDQAFRDALVEDTASIQGWLHKYQELQRRFPVETPADSFTRLYKQARQDGEETLALRMQYALDGLGVNVDPERVFTEEDFYYGSPVTLVWIGQRVQEYDPSVARAAYKMVLDDHPDSDRVFDALVALGDLEANDANDEQAIVFYQRAEKEYPTHPRLIEAMIKQADAMRRLNRHADAREKYRQIVANRDWRGDAHAEALYKIGASYAEQGELEQAQGFYERVYIGYPVFAEWASKAYLESGRALLALGRADDARSTFDEFLAQEGYRTTKAYPEIKKARSAL